MAEEGGAKTALVEINHQLEAMSEKFRAALPAHIPVERFQRVIQTAINTTPDLLKVERRSLWNAAMKAAQDGLLPDGREAALIPFRDKTRGLIAQYMPMVGGIRKKVRNSGEVATWESHVVFEKDFFDYQEGDSPFLVHKPAITEADRGKPIAVYSIAVLKSGEKSREVMSIGEVLKVRNVSRAKDSGPWRDWFEEMARKTVIRRHAKSLPMSTDLDDLLRRDEDLYAFDDAKKVEGAKAKQGLAGKLDALAHNPAKVDPITEDDTPAHDEETGEVIDDQALADEVNNPPASEPAKEPAKAPEKVQETAKPAEAAKPAAEPAKAASEPAKPAGASSASKAVILEEGRQAAMNGGDRAPPSKYKAGGKAAEVWLEGYDAAMAEADTVVDDEIPE